MTIAPNQPVPLEGVPAVGGATVIDVVGDSIVERKESVTLGVLSYKEK